MAVHLNSPVSERIPAILEEEQTGWREGGELGWRGQVWLGTRCPPSGGGMSRKERGIESGALPSSSRVQCKNTG